MIYTGDPVHDAEIYYMEQENSEYRELGRCEYCGEPVLVSDSYYIGLDREYAHKECVHKAEERINNYL